MTDVDDKENDLDDSSSAQPEPREDDVRFSRVSAVVTHWVSDFLFLSLCRNFKNRNLEEFNNKLGTFEDVVKNMPQNEKVLVCAFLARVIHGQHLDVNFENDKNVSPLMSAAKIWSELKETADDESLAENLSILLFVQSVAVCMEKGTSASCVLQWFEDNLDFPSALRVKLRTVVESKDVYHPFITSFSYNRLLETTDTFVDAFLKSNPSDYLFKAGAKALQSPGSKETLKDTISEDEDDQTPEPCTVKVNKNKKKSSCVSPNKSKRRLLSTKMCDLWIPESCKRPTVVLTRISKKERSSALDEFNDMDTTALKKRKPRTKWTWEEDRQLTVGVQRHGLGHWSRILHDFDFGSRTGVMLKDRWRTLSKSHVV
ncbi:unnamed protein product [Knipowitschia caucasica]